MAATRLRLAILGLGSAGMRHASAATACDEVELVGVADTSPEARLLARDLGADAVENLEDLLALTPDAVVIALPHALLADAAHKALDASAHVLIEKPLALDVASARRVTEHADRLGLNLMVNFNHRFRPEYLRASDLVRAGAVGEVTFVSAQMSSGDGPLPKWVWAPDIAGGGMMTYNGIHTLDHLIWLAGSRPARVTAMTGNLHFQENLEDTLAGTIQFENGALAVVSQVKTKAKKTIGVWETTVIGRAGTLRVESDRTVTCASEVRDLKEILPEENRFVTTLQHFAKSILAGKPPIPGAHDALRALATLTAMYRSAKSGVAVNVEAV